MKYVLFIFLLFASVFFTDAQSVKKYGVVNLEGEIIVPLIYEKILPFENGYARVIRRERYGLIDSSGKEILECKYQDIRDILTDRIVIKLNNKYGVIDFRGNVIISFDQSRIVTLANGFFLAYKSITCGVYDNNGNITVPFSNNILVPFSGDRSLLFSVDSFRQNTKMIDYRNNEIPAFTNKRIRDLGNGYLGISQPQKGIYKVVDINGREINPQVQLDDSQTFVGEYLRYSIDGKLGLINIRGEQVLAPVYKRIFDFNDGYAKVLKDSTRFGDNQYGVVDTAGREVIRCMYDGIGEFSDDRIMAFAEQKYGYLDEKGRVVIPFEYDEGNSFQDHMAIVAKARHYGVIDTFGRIVLPFEYDDIKYLGASVFAVFRNGKWVIIDKAKHQLGSAEYDSVGKSYANKYIAVSVNRKWGVLDYSGKVVLPFEYSAVDNYGDDVFVVGK